MIWILKSNLILDFIYQIITKSVRFQSSKFLWLRIILVKDFVTKYKEQIYKKVQ